MKIFITGATGFIGRHLVDALVGRGHQLLLLVRSHTGAPDRFGHTTEIGFLGGDLTDMAAWSSPLKGFKPDTAIHLAWQGLPDYSPKVCNLNLKYGNRLFETIAQLGCECTVSIGSCWEYKKISGAVGERAELEWQQPFPAAKNTLLRIGKQTAEEYGVKFYWPRIFFVYGPGQRETSLIPHIINSVKNGTAPAVEYRGNRNDFIYVKDVAEAIVGIVENQPAEVAYNIGAGKSVSVARVISMVRQAMRCESDISESRSQAGKDNFWADISRIKKDIGWSSKYSFEQGIADTVRHYAACTEVDDKRQFAKG